jgi:hypothetical protein
MTNPPLSPLVEERLRLLFPPSERDNARGLLVEQCATNIPNWKSANLNRLRCAVLKISDGDLDRLRQAIETAKIDFRDVLTAADFAGAESYKYWTPERKW